MAGCRIFYHSITLYIYPQKSIWYLILHTSSNYLLISCLYIELILGSVLLSMFKGFLITKYLKNYVNVYLSDLLYYIAIVYHVMEELNCLFCLHIASIILCWILLFVLRKWSVSQSEVLFQTALLFATFFDSAAEQPRNMKNRPVNHKVLELGV